MINAADLPAVREREAAQPAAATSQDATTAVPPAYPSKQPVLENGRYYVADLPK